ncbi:VanZ family protein [Psychrobacillus glaciei]|uniref:VanZ family protein n=1 Tax=Psychrobacillus glaciei TaxID=2283160 RepID=A0A5J6SNI4_9BACI|nr:VanZ family protein [Psychrobacillus glaciei]QFF99003.1 VanZ family protein [Psychrobacillus glaciei]
MDKKFESYIDQIVKDLDCDKEEKKEISEEISDHLKLLKQDYIEQGFTDEKAINKALECFGDEKQLRQGYKESISPYYKLFKISNWIIFSLSSFVVLWMLIFQRILQRVRNYSHGFNQSDYFFSNEVQEGFFAFNIDAWKLNINLIPFKNTINYIINHDKFNLDIVINNTLGNILIFIPLGIFLPILFKRYTSFSKAIAFSIIVSFTIESIQLLLQIGQFDIDDLILNGIGSIVGFLFIKLIFKFQNIFQKPRLFRS